MIVNRLIIAVGFLCLYLNVVSQDLIERTQLGLSLSHNSASSLVADQIYNKSNLISYSPFSLQPLNKNREDAQFHGVTLKLNKSIVKSMHNNDEMQLDIPVGEGTFVTLKLYPYDIRSAGYQCSTEAGQAQSNGTISFFKGGVADDPSSSAHLSIINDKIQIVISDKDGNYNVGMLEDGSGYVFFNDMDLGEMPFECGTTEEITSVINEKIEVKQDTDKSGECVKVYVEVDYNSYLNFGSNVFEAEAFALAAFGEVATIYENSGIPIEVSEVKVWTSNDPYSGELSPSAALNYLVNNIRSFNGDLFHLISAKNSNSFGGIAYLTCRGNGVCNATAIGTNVPFAVSQTSTSYRSYPTYSWTVNVLAHEMGHNMGAPHTQACAWGPNNNTAIDGCSTIEGNCGNPGFPTVGTIMSYCHFYSNIGISLTTGFGAEVGGHIYSEYQYASTRYLSSCSGDEVFVAGCMDADDHNYNPEATQNDDSCLGTCYDNIQNGDETGIDCGGNKCDPCQESVCNEIIDIQSSYVSDFERDFGIWTQTDNDDINWIRQSGNTPSANTGPTIAAQSDYYIFVEASNPNFPDKEAVVQSPCLNIESLIDPSLSFNYHMYGTGMGSIIINAITNNGDTINLWTRSGDQGNQWLEAEVSLKPIKNLIFKIEIIAYTGTNFRSDMAIDAFSIIDLSENTCNDGIKNGSETQIDCGGALCVPCESCDADDLTITSNTEISTSSTNRIKNSILISAPVSVMNNAELVWQAGGEIEINSTFEIKAGATVLLETAACEN